MTRGHFTATVRDTLMRRAGGRCSNPTCRKETLGPSSSLKDKAICLGAAAHIKAASPGGPRYDAGQTEAERHDINNGIWLCEACESLIDKNGGSDYSVGDLLIWKIAAERAASEAILRGSQEVLRSAVDTLLYINVPRLLHYSAISQTFGEFPAVFAAGIPQSGYIWPELNALRQAIRGMNFPTIDWSEAVNSVSEPIGMLVSFSGSFWTKNGPRSGERYKDYDFGNLKVAPHIYSKAKDRRFIIAYDPKYMTTSTSTVEFSGGRINVAGFATIKKVDGQDVWATPLFIGLRVSPEGRALMDALARNTRDRWLR